MSTPTFRMMETTTPSQRMEALFELMEHWLGPRDPSYGEPAPTLDAIPLPGPLRRLYEFAGRWPDRARREDSPYVVRALAFQDYLISIPHLRRRGDRVGFVLECQECWTCFTLAAGDDPPVWCLGDQWDEKGAPFRGEKLVSSSLSSFLVDFCLRELTFGSQTVRRLDEKGTAQERFGSAQPLWVDGEYVSGQKDSFYLLDDILIAQLDGTWWLGTNSDAGAATLAGMKGHPVYR